MKLEPGIKGFLRFLCISLFVLWPLSAAATWAQWQRELSSFPDGARALLQPVTTTILIYCVVFVATCFVAGATLYDRRPSAIRNIKIVIAMNPIVHFVILPAVMLNTLSGTDITYWDIVYPDGISVLLWSVIWYLYLQNSERVRITLREPHQAQMPQV